MTNLEWKLNLAIQGIYKTNQRIIGPLLEDLRNRFDMLQYGGGLGAHTQYSGTKMYADQYLVRYSE